ncbi:MAG: type IX secretion system sortase PorU [Bacteroidota bacterium]
MNRYRILIMLMTFVGYGDFFWAQELTLDLTWGETMDTVHTETDMVQYPGLEDSYFNGSSLRYLKSFERPGQNTNWEIAVVSYEIESPTEAEKKFLDRRGWNIPDDVQLTYKNHQRMGEPLCSVELFPFIMENGQVKRLKKVELQKDQAQVYTTKTHEFAENSVLQSGSGSWYKISLRQSGVYKVDYSFLEEAGVDMEGLNADAINVYGNGFGRLPEANSEDRPDDLIKNNIQMFDGGDGSFDEGDYFIFYGHGPHRWEKANNDAFERVLNNYASISTYFINVNGAEPPARIQDADLSSAPSTTTVNDYNSFTIHEQETRNLIKGGQRWYGETFDTELTQTFSMNIPNVKPGANATVKAFMACKEGSSGGNTNFEVRHNGSLVGSAAFSQTSSDSYSRTGFTSASGDLSLSSSTFSLSVRFNRVSPTDEGYLDYLLVNTRSNLNYGVGDLTFRDLNSVGAGNVSTFEIANTPSDAKVWEVTTVTNPKSVQGSLTNGTFQFKVATDSLRTFIAFDPSNYKTPEFVGKVRNQNLHGLAQADNLIVTHKLFLNQANRLASLHKKNGVSTHVVTIDQIYNEFSGGTQDPTAIKFFAKMFYDRAEGDPDKMPKYLTLFGDGTYDPKDRVSNNNYMVPVYHTVTSEGYISTLLSDDYFGFLDESESFDPSDELDIAVGRLVATTEEDAITLVNKIEHYMKNGSSLYAGDDLSCDDDGYISTHGDWRLRYTLLADDEENGYFVVNDLEPAYDYVKSNYPEMNARKIYSDAYTQTTTAGGERYPDVNEELNRSIASGSILTCYVGHGGAMGAASERIITIGQIRDWENIDKLTLFVSATCEFGRIDDNERVSAGEWMALNKTGGAIALMTTTRAVYFTTNSITTQRFFENVYEKNSDQEPLTFGEIITRTKNDVVGGSNNKRSFMLLGDPALQIALPHEKVVLDSVNNVDVTQQNDTIKALSKVRMRGHVEDQFGNQLTNFNGIIQPSILDKAKDFQTLGQDAGSPVINFEQQLNVLFRGKSSIKNGVFEYEFIVPKDIDYNYGRGKASYYGNNEQDVTAGGYSDEFVIGGVDTTGLDDDQGPEITLYLNDDTFVNGGLTDATPVLMAELYDESGINTVGNGIGHDITLVIDQNTSEATVLNEYYNSDLDTYQSGELNYQLSELSEGLHTLTMKAWDVNNNSSEKTLEFNVQESSEIALDHVLNYPNPFTTKTEFFFEHNQVCASLEAQVEIFTVTGRLVRTINKIVETRGFRTEGIFWDGKDEFGDQLAKGVYVYRITVENPDGQTTRAMEKLYLLK